MRGAARSRNMYASPTMVNASRTPASCDSTCMASHAAPFVLATPAPAKITMIAVMRELTQNRNRCPRIIRSQRAARGVRRSMRSRSAGERSRAAFSPRIITPPNAASRIRATQLIQYWFIGGSAISFGDSHARRGGRRPRGAARGHSNNAVMDSSLWTRRTASANSCAVATRAIVHRCELRCSGMLSVTNTRSSPERSSISRARPANTPWIAQT